MQVFPQAFPARQVRQHVEADLIVPDEPVRVAASPGNPRKSTSTDVLDTVELRSSVVMDSP